MKSGGIENQSLKVTTQERRNQKERAGFHTCPGIRNMKSGEIENDTNGWIKPDPF